MFSTPVFVEGLLLPNNMSDESAPSPETSSNPPAEGAPRVRRISNPRIKKPTKPAAATDADANDSPPPADPPKSSGFPDFSEPTDEPSSRGDWPEPEAASSGAASSPENPKRKRRRKKGKGGGNNLQNAAPGNEVEPISAANGEAQEPSAPQSQAQQPRPQHQAPRPKLDPELLAKFAWKIYLAEVSEEGVALIGDNEAKELSRRCFRLAEIFMEEQTRRR
jgi:hypothetical protein